MICVDANVVAKCIFFEEYTDQAIALLADTTRGGEPIVGPPLLPAEITNIIRQRMLRDRLSLIDARRVLSQFYALSVAIVDLEGLSESALTLADVYGLPAVYDAYYVATAKMLGCDLWTDDRRLLRAVRGEMGFVKWIGDYPLT